MQTTRQVFNTVIPPPPIDHTLDPSFCESTRSHEDAHIYIYSHPHIFTSTCTLTSTLAQFVNYSKLLLASIFWSKTTTKQTEHQQQKSVIALLAKYNLFKVNSIKGIRAGNSTRPANCRHRTVVRLQKLQLQDRRLSFRWVGRDDCNSRAP